MTKLTFGPACFLGLKNHRALLTLIPMEPVTSDPSLNSALHKFKIDYGLAIFRVLEELGRGALRARLRPKTLEDLVWSYGF